MSAAFGEILRRTGRRMKAAIAQIPDGTYGFQDVLDDDGLEARDVLFKLEVRKSGERIVFDFTGSSASTRQRQSDPQRRTVDCLLCFEGTA